MYLIKFKTGVLYIKYKQSNGKYTQTSTGTKNRKIAQQKLNEFKEKTNDSKLLILNVNKKITVSEYFNSFKCKSIFQGFIRIVGIDRRLNDITSNDIQRFIIERCKDYKTYSPNVLVSHNTVNTELKYLRVYFNKAIKSGYCISNPALDVSLIKVPKKLFNVFSNSDRKRLLDVITDIDINNIVRFALLTGCRRGEIINVLWNNVNFEKRTIIICSNDEFKTKNRDIRVIPMNDELHDLLKSILSTNVCKSKYVFHKSNGFKYNGDYISKQFKQYCRQIGIDESLHFHSIRHTVVTELVKNDISINKVKEFIGHKSISTTLKYTHLNVEDYRSVADMVKVI